MAKLSNILLTSASQIHAYVKPPIIEREYEMNIFLQKMYPNIDWSVVDFLDGLPWFMHPKSAGGIVLPSTWERKRVKAYFADYQTNRAKNLGIIVHECIHVAQYQKWSGGGFFFRSFLVQYFAAYWQLLWKNRSHQTAYLKHPLEIPAFQQEQQFLEDIRTERIINLKGDLPPHLLDEKWNVTPKTSFILRCLMAIFVLILGIAKMTVEVLFLLPAGILYLLGRTLKILRL